jgi:threonylcarbamoyladenosine tRNA methylthiotransferase MtaB
VKYAILTFGCRVNQADTLALEAALAAHGAQAVAAEHADIVVVNTCSVTATADRGARQAIRRLHRVNPRARIVATGCYATRDRAAVGSLPGVVAVVGNDAKDDLDGRVLSLTTAERFGDGDDACGAALAPGLAGRTAWTLGVQTGCDEACAYCIVPVTRGRPRSRSVDDVRREVARLVRAGYKEVVLTGVHLGAYGRDLDPPTSLFALLHGLVADAGGPRFRVGSLEPMDLTEEIVDLVRARSEALAPHFHLPLQHGDDDVLAAMRRPYTLAQFARRVDLVRARLPHAAIGSDLIVGFPGETDAAFERSLAYLRGSPLTHLHVFAYSDRPGTPASRMSGRVHGATVRERARRAREVGLALATAFRRGQAGSVRRALTLDAGTSALTDNYIKVQIPPGHGRNEWVDVRL